MQMLGLGEILRLTDLIAVGKPGTYGITKRGQGPMISDLFRAKSPCIEPDLELAEMPFKCLTSAEAAKLSTPTRFFDWMAHRGLRAPSSQKSDKFEFLKIARTR